MRTDSVCGAAGTGQLFARSTADSDGTERDFATPEASEQRSPNEISTNKYKKLLEFIA